MRRGRREASDAAADEMAGRRGGDADCDVGLPTVDIDHGVERRQLDFYAGMADDEGRHSRVHQGRKRAWEGDAHDPAEARVMSYESST